jgi:hypothetical protein
MVALPLFVKAQGHDKMCFDEKKEITLAGSKFSITSRAEIFSNGQKIAGLSLPKGFKPVCVVSSTFKTDLIIFLSLAATDYDEQRGFIFRLATKESKIMWTSVIKNKVEPYSPFTNEKLLIVPAHGEVVSFNPDLGSVRWTFKNNDTEGVNFKKITLQGNILQLESEAYAAAPTPKFDVYVDGKPVPPKKEKTAVQLKSQQPQEQSH